VSRNQPTILHQGYYDPAQDLDARRNPELFGVTHQQAVDREQLIRDWQERDWQRLKPLLEGQPDAERDRILKAWSTPRPAAKLHPYVDIPEQFDVYMDTPGQKNPSVNDLIAAARHFQHWHIGAAEPVFRYLEYKGDVYVASARHVYHGEMASRLDLGGEWARDDPDMHTGFIYEDEFETIRKAHGLAKWIKARHEEAAKTQQPRGVFGTAPGKYIPAREASHEMHAGDAGAAGVQLDAKPRSFDPTRTVTLRKGFRAAGEMRLRQFRATLRKAVVEFPTAGAASIRGKTCALPVMPLWPTRTEAIRSEATNIPRA
jgi:hypothetical protein